MYPPTLVKKKWTRMELGLADDEGNIDRGPVWKEIAINKAAGTDEVHGQITKDPGSKRELALIIEEIFNTDKRIPSKWLDGKIFFIPKEKTTTISDVAKARPIVVDTTINKLL